MRGLSTLRERIVYWLAQADPAHREMIYASLFLVFVFVVGTTGYIWIEGWPWTEAFYMTFITLTTIGFTEVHELSTTSRFFTILIAFLGIGTAALIGTRGAQLLLTSQRLRERYMKRKIDNMDDHYILCGYGSIGRRIAHDLEEAGKPFIIIDRDDEIIEELDETEYAYVHGDAEEEETLIEAGIERAKVLILALPEDSANVFVTLMTREINEDIFILTRTSYHRNRRKLLHAGADKVVAPDGVGADRMAQVLLKPNVDQFMEEVLHTGALGLEMEEVPVAENAPLADQSLAESNFRQRFDAVVIGVLDHHSGEMKFNPSPQEKLRAGDILVVLGNNEMIERLRQEGCTP